MARRTKNPDHPAATAALTGAAARLQIERLEDEALERCYETAPHTLEEELRDRHHLATAVLASHGLTVNQWTVKWTTADDGGLSFDTESGGLAKDGLPLELLRQMHGNKAGGVPMKRFGESIRREEIARQGGLLIAAGWHRVQALHAFALAMLGCSAKCTAAGLTSVRTGRTNGVNRRLDITPNEAWTVFEAIRKASPGMKVKAAAESAASQLSRTKRFNVSTRKVEQLLSEYRKSVDRRR